MGRHKGLQVAICVRLYVGRATRLHIGTVLAVTHGIEDSAVGRMEGNGIRQHNSPNFIRATSYCLLG
jgi:hypothetical protein